MSKKTMLNAESVLCRPFDPLYCRLGKCVFDTMRIVLGHRSIESKVVIIIALQHIALTGRLRSYAELHWY